MATNNAANFGTGTAGQVLTGNGTGVEPTFQAVAAGKGLGSLSYPPWGTMSGLTFSPFVVTSTSIGLVATANATYLQPMGVPSPMTITSLILNCNLFVSSDTCRLGIYTMDNSANATLLTDFGTVTVTGTGTKTLGSLSQALTPGYYYLATNFNTWNNQYRVASVISAIPLASATTSGFRFNNAAGTFPSSITAVQIGGTYVQVPLLYFTATLQ